VVPSVLVCGFWFEVLGSGWWVAVVDALFGQFWHDAPKEKMAIMLIKMLAEKLPIMAYLLN